MVNVVVSGHKYVDERWRTAEPNITSKVFFPNLLNEKLKLLWNYESFVTSVCHNI